MPRRHRHHPRDLGYTMADFRAEMHRRKHGEQHDPRPRRSTPTSRFFAQLVSNARKRLAQLEGRPADHVLPCPWASAIGGECWRQCPCGDLGNVTVKFMRDHYERTVFDYRGLC